MDDALLHRSSGSLALLWNGMRCLKAIVVQIDGIANRSQSRLDGQVGTTRPPSSASRHLYFCVALGNLVEQEPGRAPGLCSAALSLAGPRADGWRVARRCNPVMASCHCIDMVCGHASRGSAARQD